MSIDLWHRAATAVRERYRASAPALYGAGLHADDDPVVDLPVIGVPTPRRAPAPSGADAGRGPLRVTVASR